MFHIFRGSPDKPLYNKVYELIMGCLNDINRYYESPEEVRKAIRSLRRFADDQLDPSRNTAFDSYLTRMERTIERWSFDGVLLRLNMLQFTSNRVETENACTKGRNGVKGVGVQDDRHKALRFTDRLLAVRQHNTQISTYNAMTMAAKDTQQKAPGDLGDAQTHLTMYAYRLLNGEWLQRDKYDVEFIYPGSFFLMRKEADRAAAKEGETFSTRRIGDTYYRERLVTVDVSRCRRHLYLSCTCGFYQRTLIPCRHILKVKDGRVSIQHDVHPQWFLGYSTGGFKYMRAFDDNTNDGPRLAGVLEDNVKLIQAAYAPAGGEYIKPFRVYASRQLKAPVIITGLSQEAGVDFTDAPPPQDSSDEDEDGVPKQRCMYRVYKDKGLELLNKAAAIAAVPVKGHQAGIIWRANLADLEEKLGWVVEQLEETHQQPLASGPIDLSCSPSGRVSDGFVPSHGLRSGRRTKSAGQKRNRQ